MKRAVIIVLCVWLVACGGGQRATVLPVGAGAASASADNEPLNLSAQIMGGQTSPIGHIVIIIQENRTPDNLFQGLPGADIANRGLNSKGQFVPLHPVPFQTGYDITHSHNAFDTEYADGKMNGFDQVVASNACKKSSDCAYGYVPRYQTKPYFYMATTYAFADRMFQSNQGPSFPAHQYLISGTSTTTPGGPAKAAGNPYLAPHGRSGGGGCDGPRKALVDTIDNLGEYGDPVFPCFDRPTLGDLLDAKHVSWRYYQQTRGPGLWHPYDAIKHIRYGPDNANIVTPSSAILSDIAHGKLAAVSWVAPSADDSDHAGNRSSSGPAWVASIVNAMGRSAYWKDSAIFITWDDWGGWYDHVKPPIRNSYELGFRVPLIVVSPYAIRGVSHTQYEFGSILRFVEETFQTGSMNTTDREANSLQGIFDFKKPARLFSTVPAPPFLDRASGTPDSD